MSRHKLNVKKQMLEYLKDAIPFESGTGFKSGTFNY